MKIYHYAPTTGEILGEGTGDPSPLEPGKVLVPAHATLIKPPAPEAGKTRCFRKGMWIQVEDRRGKPHWNTTTKAPVAVTDLGPSPAGTTTLPPGPYQVWQGKKWGYGPASIIEAREDKKAALAAKRFEQETQGVTVGGMPIKTDRDSQAAVTNTWVRCQLNPGMPIEWKTANGWIELSREQIKAIASTVGAHVQSCFSTERGHSAAIDKLKDVPSILAYDITVGWPEKETP